LKLGLPLGFSDGLELGLRLGPGEGLKLGLPLGFSDGLELGLRLGPREGLKLGWQQAGVTSRYQTKDSTGDVQVEHPWIVATTPNHDW
jgi:hypothetical protein